MQDKNYAFLEFRSVEEASNCMALDGVMFDNVYLRVSHSALHKTACFLPQVLSIPLPHETATTAGEVLATYAIKHNDTCVHVL